MNLPAITIKEDRIRHWIGCGAQASAMVRSIITKQIPGLIEDKEKAQREKIQALRKKRKERAKARESK